VPAMVRSSCPERACLWRCRFQRVSRVAPVLPPSPAAPAMKDSGRPLSCISGFTGDRSSSCPDARIIRRCRLTGPQVAPSSSPSVSPTIRCPSRPERRILRHRLMDIRVTPDHAPLGSPRLNLQVAPDIFPSATTIDQFPGCPKSWVSHRAPIPRDSSCPESQFLG